MHDTGRLKTVKKICSLTVLLSFTLLTFATFSIVFLGCGPVNGMHAEAGVIKTRSAKVRKKQKEVKELGGHVCGLKELAIADSNRIFALYEIEHGDYPKVREHMEIANQNVKLAWKKASACEPPDSDRDGILDSMDQCPQEPEDDDDWEDEDGCPDPDNDDDDILDDEDKCPDDAEDIDEFEDEDGCPDLDNDEDSVLDKDDRCPMDPEDKDEWEDEDGCPEPDNDQDGVLDKEDKCPNEAETFNGLEDEDGCPDASDYSFIEVTDTAIEIKQKIYFATGKDRILSKSFPTLNEVALALKEHPNFQVEIGGHTDSRGNDRYNMKLSEKRSKSVRKYLIRKGGINGDRLTAIGYGETQPIDTNRTSPPHIKNGADTK